ncbi:Conserved_hypothetical protein [Hexamita inflata]|uniref:Uncharacterized protein n=1 Tax=Hexamita inflata TaxID=28002 RepID=A0AA86TYN8_9EUKA|nr:Conserved hypothetical protein [Hexamita inflata]
MAFGLIGFYGKTNTGKTTAMFKLKDEYIKNSKKQAYDLDQPTVLGGDYTHIYFISPSIKSDKTAEKNKDQNMISIEGDKQQVLDLIQSIRQMNEDVQELLQLQTQIRDFFKQCDLNKLDQQTAVLLINILKQIEQTKQKYPLLEFEETNQDIRKNLKEFYKLLYLKPITSFIRIPKIMMIFDDMSGSSLFTNSTENEFYKFIVQRRHLHVFTTMISAHSITNLFYQFRVNQTAIVLFNGLKMEQMKEYFNTIQEVQSDNFGEKQFTEIYKQLTGYYEQDFDKKSAYRYNYLYITIQPMPAIYEGFYERLK